MEDKTRKSDSDCDKMEEHATGKLAENSNVDDKGVNVRPMTPRRIYKNVIVISIVFMIMYLSFEGLFLLQSSLHRVAGMGTTNQSLLYACMLISSLFLTKLAIQKLGHKQCVSLAMIGYIVWMAANGYAVWWTMVPASMMVGFCAAPLWIGGSSYITILAKQYAQMKGQKPEVVIANFFGIFNMATVISGVFSNLISSTVLRQSPPENYTGPSQEDLALCGINDCPGNNATSNINFEKPSEHLIWILVGVYISIAVVGLIISVVFLDAIPAYFLEDRKTSSLKDDLQAACKQLIHPKQLLLTPLSIYVGLSTAFKIADWNKSFITCNLGIWMVGYNNIAFFTANAAMSFISGKLVQVTGWVPVFILMMCLEIGLALAYILWTPNPEELVLFFVLPVFSGMGEGILVTQTRAVHGFIFSDNSEAAFASYNVWKSLGSIMGFSYSSHLCMIYKLYILIIDVMLAVVCYSIVEWMLRTEKAKSQNIDVAEEK